MSDRPVHEAAFEGDVDALRRELENGGSPNALGDCDFTPLHHLCFGGGGAEAQVACVRMLIDAGAEINAPDQYQWTPLLFAASNSHAIVVAALIKAGADVNRGNENNKTPLHWACRRVDSDVEPALLLLRNGAAVNARDDDGDTPLDYAIRKSHSRLVPILLRAGAALPAETDDAYLRKVIAAGGFGRYERNHLNALVASFAPKFSHLPKELVRRVVEYAFHVGDY